MSSQKNVKKWYEARYRESGLDAQRHYPNEELLRFMGRNYFGIPAEQRKDIHILEIGCGTCANLWMVAREGFCAYGLDLSDEAIRLSSQMLENRGAADLRVGSMTQLPYKDESFDAVLDVFSAYCLDTEDFRLCLSEVERVLKLDGRFFSYTPGKASYAFQHHRPAEMLDSSTLDGILRDDSPFAGNYYPFRFVHPEEYRKMVTSAGLKVSYLETVLRSYFNQRETFEHVVLEAQKRKEKPN